jgi:hypothetical protein
MLFVKGLPESITDRELKMQFQHLTGPRWRSYLAGCGSIGVCDIIRVTNHETGEVEFHGLVEVQPAKLALRAIRELHGSKIRGHSIEVHRYQQRSPLRGKYSYNVEMEADNPRDERRRDNLSIELVPSAQTFGFFQRLFGPSDAFALKKPRRHPA